MHDSLKITSLNVAQTLMADTELVTDSVVLQLDDYRIGIRSNSTALLDRLRAYFGHAVSADDGDGLDSCDCTVYAIDAQPIDLDLSFTDWRRDPGKTGRKDAYFDLIDDGWCDGRLVRKVRTGMLFLQSEMHRIAHGPCVANDNQVINYINCQYMNRLQHRGAVICHASGIVIDNRAMAIAGFSGGGKSSLMLRMLESPGSAFLTNDRLFIESSGPLEVRAIGIPKLPRVNPGTIVSLPSLRPMLNQQQLQEFEAMPTADLWELEKKFDVDVADVYGDNRIAPQSTLTDSLILNWKRTSDCDCQIRKVNLRQRPELLNAVTKSPGPFYADEAGKFQTDTAKEDHEPYLDYLDRVDVWEATGKIDFELASETCQSILRTQPCLRTS
ncbi:HPr kinase [Rhodopirellula sp. SWK7]|nr:HPr kinase [Rhodopirellula sp. SWK7]